MQYCLDYCCLKHGFEYVPQFRSTLIIALLSLGGTAFAAPASGQLVVVNGLGNNSTTGATGNTASAVSVVVSDATGPCSTAAITYTAPTTVYANLALILTGAGVPASAVTASATAWGVGAASAPVFDAGNGALTTVGVPGGIGAGGLKAESIMRRFAVIPFQTASEKNRA